MSTFAVGQLEQQLHCMDFMGAALNDTSISCAYGTVTAANRQLHARSCSSSIHLQLRGRSPNTSQPPYNKRTYMSEAPWRSATNEGGGSPASAACVAAA